MFGFSIFPVFTKGLDLNTGIPLTLTMRHKFCEWQECEFSVNVRY